MFLQDPPGYWSRRGALPKEGIAVTSLKGAGKGGRGVLQAKEGFSPLGGAYLRLPHCLHDKKIHNPSEVTANTVTSAQLGQNKIQNRKRLDHRGRDDGETNQDGEAVVPVS